MMLKLINKIKVAEAYVFQPIHIDVCVRQRLRAMTDFKKEHYGKSCTMCYDVYINYGQFLARLHPETAYSQYLEKLKQAELLTINRLLETMLPQVATSIDMEDYQELGKIARSYSIAASEGFSAIHKTATLENLVEVCFLKHWRPTQRHSAS